MSEDTVLVGKKTRRLVNVKEAVEMFPTLDAIYTHVSNNSTLNRLFPSERVFLDYLELIVDLEKKDALESLAALCEEIYEGSMDFESNADEEMWTELDGEGFAETLYINFKELADQFRKEIAKK